MFYLSFQVNLKGCEVTPEINLSQHKYQIKLEIPSAEGMTEMWLRLSSVSKWVFIKSIERFTDLGKLNFLMVVWF